MLESGSSKTRRTVEKSTPCLAKLAASLARSNSNCMRLMCAAWIHMSSPPFVHYHSGAPTSSLASLGCLGAEEDLGVPKRVVQIKGVYLATIERGGRREMERPKGETRGIERVK